MTTVDIEYYPWAKAYVEERKLQTVVAISRVPCVGEFVILNRDHEDLAFRMPYRVLSVTHQGGLVCGATIKVEIK